MRVGDQRGREWGAGQRLEKLLEVLLLLVGQVERVDLLWTSDERAIGIAAAVVELNHLGERCHLPVTHVRPRLCDLAQPFGAPLPIGNGGVAEAGKALSAAVVAVR